MADITSYDYDAPMDEAGNPTAKFMIFRDVIKKVRFIYFLGFDCLNKFNLVHSRC